MYEQKINSMKNKNNKNWKPDYNIKTTYRPTPLLIYLIGAASALYLIYYLLF